MQNVQETVQYYYLSKKNANYKQLLRKQNAKKRVKMPKQIPKQEPKDEKDLAGQDEPPVPIIHRE